MYHRVWLSFAFQIPYFFYNLLRNQTAVQTKFKRSIKTLPKSFKNQILPDFGEGLNLT